MQRWIPWFILGLICLVIVLAYRKYTAVSVAPEPDTETEAFTSSPPEISGNLRVCKVYYTSNMDICNRPVLMDDSDAAIDNSNMNYYQLDSNVVQNHIRRLETIASGSRTEGQSNALIGLKRVLADIDTLPFKNTCQLEMTGLNESTLHPYKINQPYDGTERHGNPLHWAFCYSNVATNDLPSSIRTDRVFQRVFQDTHVDYTHPLSSTMHRRFDMKSMYNDDLLNLHCALYTNSLIQGGSAVSAFHNTRMMELTLDAAQVARLSTASGNTTTTLTITRMRPVRVLNGVLVADPISTAEAKKSFLSLLEVIRTQSAFMHRQKAFNPTLYKMRFHLCTADTQAVPANVLTNKIYNKYIQLMVPKPIHQPISQIMRLRPSFQTQVYDFITPHGPVDDLVFSMPDIDDLVIQQT